MSVMLPILCQKALLPAEHYLWIDPTQPTKRDADRRVPSNWVQKYVISDFWLQSFQAVIKRVCVLNCVALTVSLSWHQLLIWMKTSSYCKCLI